ncbi:MAG: phospholipase D-like domain-containing protein [Clostridium baratii]|nr:phospholipase D-like domain-containing protein [Clostridium baratii]
MSVFYWHSKTEKGSTLIDELSNLDKVREINIATAYFSEEGYSILKGLQEKYNLKKSSINIFLSPEFTMKKPSELLKKLVEIANVNIIFKINFHPKVYWLKTFRENKNKLIFGSSNLTLGGFSQNLEFDRISETDRQEDRKLEIFFKYCEKNSEKVTEEIIKYYFENESRIREIESNNKKLKKLMYSYETRNDPFSEEDFDLSERIFKYYDYEILFFRNQKLIEESINKRRKELREKILDIHDSVYKQLEGEKVYCHWNKQNITSIIRPCMFNKDRVGWIGVRYGKSKGEIDLLNSGWNYDDYTGFQKHACLQFAIVQNGLDINLFHAVKNGAIDRGYLHEKINVKKDEIIKELNKLKGENLVWYIYENDKQVKKFDLDLEDSKEFIDFYKKNDTEGRESFLSYLVKPNDPRLRSIESVSELIVDKFKKMLPLYNLLAWRILK